MQLPYNTRETWDHLLINVLRHVQLMQQLMKHLLRAPIKSYAVYSDAAFEKIVSIRFDSDTRYTVDASIGAGGS